MDLFGLTGITLLTPSFIFGIEVIMINVYGHTSTVHFARLILAVLLIIAGIIANLRG